MLFTAFRSVGRQSFADINRYGLSLFFCRQRIGDLRVCTLLLLVTLPFLARAQDTSAITHFELLSPRPFGYVIGDVIEHELRVAVVAPYKLQKGMLPAPGPMSYWLELRDLDLITDANDEETRYQVNLTYQTFYAPLAASLRTVPGFKLTFSASDESFDITVPSWDFTMSPIRELATRKVEGQEYMRPDTPPPGIDSSHYGPRLVMLAIAAVAAALYLLYYYTLWPFHARQGRPFARARRKIRALSGHAADVPTYRQAVRTVHGAFNVTNGGPLFAESLDSFLARHPAFRPLRAEIERFFKMSHEAFFSNRAAAAVHEYPLTRIEGFCDELQTVERGAA